MQIIAKIIGFPSKLKVPMFRMVFFGLKYWGVNDGCLLNSMPLVVTNKKQLLCLFLLLALKDL